MVQINGKETNAAGMVLMDYLKEAGYHPEQIAVECNEEIVPKVLYGEKVLQDGDVVEVVSFVGGG